MASVPERPAGTGPVPGAPATSQVAVAVPLPLPTPLTYLVPTALLPRVRAGVRVRVPVGKRRLTGIVSGPVAGEAPGELRAIEAVLDDEPVLGADLLAVGRFLHEYYLVPPGEALQALLPRALPARGTESLRPTLKAAMRRELLSGEEQALVEELLARGKARRGELLAAATDPTALAARLERLESAGFLAARNDAAPGGGRYETAVELAAGDPTELLAAAGRSRPGRAVLELLARLARPATLSEVTGEVGCGPAVVRRLSALGLIRLFQQPVRRELSHHRLSGTAGAPVRLTGEQEQALAEVGEALSARRFETFLLAGVTGSGKSEVYLRAAEATLAMGRGAVILVPEIALVPALARAVRERFGDRLALLHSAMPPAERHQEWERIRSGEASVVVGPRSAVFAPVPDLGLLVVDEEHDESYKQDQVPRYHARDTGLIRAREAGAVALLVSATPSLESRWNAARGRFRPLALSRRIGTARLPEATVVDLRQEPVPRHPGEVVFSRVLHEELRAALETGGQAILLRNRRGYAPLLLCRACGEEFRCEACGLPRTVHRRERRLRCHYCGAASREPESCPTCGERSLEAIGSGTERVEERLQELFPEIPIGVLDRDEVRRKGGLSSILATFERGETRILIGTQMVAKGHHFPEVSLTAVLAADSYLSFPDFRAVEKTYAQLVQLAGRAGRGQRPGRFVVQTHHPDHYAIRAALANDDDGFVREELRFRRAFHYPPYTRMIQVLLRDRQRERGHRWMAELAARLEAVRAGEPELRLTGPAPAPFERLRGEWRFQLLLRGPSSARLRDWLRSALPVPWPRGLVVDIDPCHLL
ncbi:MAG: primosomal protein N' [Acidobacteria bacterium]|nr:primosomal protein N' [Thermoanaerobaculia bacterium]NLN10135.1 primosomal protein N' [Acidobacteriota bacterium]MBP7813955.1 primosomal protein N' [Thermoanaerobaculia bacterium]HRR13113.1 primosomal protein N' [Thermoanaerobaculia bacterium]HRS35022.1 primosomal protein N' [Thermoanaerobaculia bacterium]